MFTLQTPVLELHKIGKILANKLKNFGISILEDLIFYFPYRYDDFSKISPIIDIKPEQLFTIKGKVIVIANHRTPLKNKIITEAIISDKTASIKAIWFSQPYLTKILKPGETFYFSGKTESNHSGLYLSNPVYEKIAEYQKETLHTARLVPIYSLGEKITQKQFRFLVKQALAYSHLIADWLPKEIKNSAHLADLNFSLQQIHFPNNKYLLEKALERLKFNELFLVQMQSQKVRKDLQKLKAEKIDFHLKETKKFTASLHFQLTDSQRKASWEILKDLQRDLPTNRLLEGDVGSGKTMVAAIALFNAILSGWQVAFMTPTEILTKQHFETVCQLFKKFKISIALITRTDKKFLNTKGELEDYKKSDLLKKISAGKVDLVLGTHALIQKEVEFKKLALIIIDEQHRFGVEQRAYLSQKIQGGKSPHFLSMTATPIPRSLALTIFGDLDLSIIDEMPKGRKKIITKIVSPENRNKAYQFIAGEIKKGRQAFVICPLIEESDKLGIKAATTEYEKLKTEIFPDFKIGLLHGKMKNQEKEKIRQELLENKINILVATSVIEVGVDIPNASVMTIEGAERFGLAQLYQFRGRVGRSEHQSYCFLFTESNNLNTKKRLEALLTAKNGFELAEKDLEIRGPGEIYGAEQSGYLSSLRLAKLSDYAIIDNTKKWAEEIIKKDPELAKYPLLRKKLENINNVHLE